MVRRRVNIEYIEIRNIKYVGPADPTCYSTYVPFTACHSHAGDMYELMLGVEQWCSSMKSGPDRQA